MTKYSIKDQIMDALHDHIKCSGDELSDIVDDVLRAIEKGFIERKQEISDKHKLAQELIDSILKEIKCDLCHLRFDCSVVYDPEECALEVNEGKNE